MCYAAVTCVTCLAPCLPCQRRQLTPNDLQPVLELDLVHSPFEGLLMCCESPVPQDDMQLAVDFFPYFRATAAVLDADTSLYCVSSWNDNGQVSHQRQFTLSC